MRRMSVNTKAGQTITVNLIPRDATVSTPEHEYEDINEMPGVLAVPSSEDPEAVSAAMKKLREKINNGELKITYP